MIYSIDISRLNKMPRAKLLFGDGTCETCGSDEPLRNVGAINYCDICFLNRLENKAPQYLLTLESYLDRNKNDSKD